MSNTDRVLNGIRSKRVCKMHGHVADKDGYQCIRCGTVLADE